jgi:hypothetical protein
MVQTLPPDLIGPRAPDWSANVIRGRGRQQNHAAVKD